MEKVTVYDVEPAEFIEILASRLKKMPAFSMPEWAKFVKTSVARARPPFEEDWWWLRAASILRQLYIKKVVGVGRLRTRYGGKKNRGMQPSKFFKGSGKIIRILLQKAEQVELVEKIKDKRYGRRLTKKGIDFLEEIAKEIKEKEEREKKWERKEEEKEERKEEKVEKEEKAVKKEEKEKKTEKEK